MQHKFKDFIFKLDSKTEVISKVQISLEERIDLIRNLNKLPGEQGLDKRILLAREQAANFDKYGYYTNVVSNSRDYVSFWDQQKEMCYSGLLIDEEFYITGDYYFYLNYAIISHKNGKIDMPEIRDSDLWFYQLIELAELTSKFTVTGKRRQWGFSLKMLFKILKRFWFEPRFAGKFIASDEKYLNSGWLELDSYRDHLHTNTAWKRPLDPGKRLDWQQRIKMADGTSRGLKSTLKGITTKNNATAVVSGKTDEAFIDEAGVNKLLLDTIGFLKPALQDGNIIYGNIHIGGAAGNVKDSEDLKEMMYDPDKYNMLSVPNVWDKNKEDERVGIFVPAYYSYGSYKDEFGNSDIEGAKAELNREALKEKKTSFKSYMIYRAQNPMNLGDMFASREENIFPTHIIQPHYDFIENNYKPLEVTLYEGTHGISHNLGSKHPMVEDFPVKKDTNRIGAVIIDEAPLPNAPFGLYYTGIDTISPVKSSGSVSLQSIYIYKAAHELDGEYTMDKPVAWFAGRSDDVYNTYQTTLDLIKYYNCRSLIENNNYNFIEWMVGKKQQNFMMKRNEVALGKDLIVKSSVDTSQYGLNVSRLKSYLWSLLVEYCEEVIGERFNEDTGKSVPIYGVERIKDKMLLKEMLNFTPKKNCDRIDSMCITLLAAKSNTNRGVKVTSKKEISHNNSVNYSRQLSNSMFRPRVKLNPFRK